MINRDVPIVGVEFALPEQVCICCLAGIAHVAEYPGVGIVHRIGLDQPAIVVVVVQDPSQSQLAQVREATGPLGFNLGFAQYRQQQCCQCGQGEDNGQQFEQAEASTPL